MGKTLKELFKGSPLDKAVKEDKETFIEQETSGLRVRSAVELNNPLIYGNESLRIANRTTSTLDTMKSATGGEAGDGGLVGKGLSKLTGGKVSSISQARDAVNSKLGIPSTPNPSRLLEDIVKINSSEPITKDNVGEGLQGTGLGNFLKDTGGGNPKTLGKQAIGKGIGVAKDKLRGALFGEQQSVGSNDIEPQVALTTNERTYSDVNKSKRLPSEEGVKKDLEGTKLDLSLVSPIYGVKRGFNEGVFGKTEYGFNSNTDNFSSPTIYSPERTYTTAKDGKLASVQKLSLENKYGLANGSDKLNLIGKNDYDSIDEYGRIKKGDEVIGEDLIPFNIGKVGDKRTPFRVIMTGINETVSPSWNSNKMLGNPFPFYTYSQVERSLSFNLKIVCGSPIELTSNWEKIEQLTKMAYPSITKSKLVNPPIIQFRLGDIYYDKHGFIENLTYTIPDNGVWETNGNLGFLPKFIEIAITIKFIEDTSVLNGLYGYKKSKAAIEKINEEEKANYFSGDDRAGNSDVSLNDRFGESGKPVKVNVRGVKLASPTLPTADLSGLQKIKTLDKGVTISAPKDKEEGIDSPIKSQSATADKLDGKPPIEAIKEAELKNSITTEQATAIASYKALADKVEVISQSQLPKDVSIPFYLKYVNSIYIKASANDGREQIVQVSPTGNKLMVYQKEV
jgi:hypothetical protein